MPSVSPPPSEPLRRSGSAVALGLCLLTVLLQATNFVVDWKQLALRPGFTVNYDVVVGDNGHYFGIARNLLLGRGYTDSTPEIMTVRPGEPTYVRAPGMPLLYTLPLLLFCRDTGYEVTEENVSLVWLALFLVNLGLLSLGAVYFGKLCQLVLSDARLGVLGGVLYVVWPSHLVFLSPALTKFTPETIVAPLVVLVCYLLLSRQPAVSSGLVGGLLLGYCLLTRVYLVLLPVVLLAASVFIGDRLMRRRIWLVVLISTLVFLPWPVRNYLVFHDFAPSSQGGILLWFGNNAEARGSIDGRMYDEGLANPEKFPLLAELERKYPGLVQLHRYSETEAKAILQREALAWMKANPASLVRLWARKLAITFYPANFGTSSPNVLTAGVLVLFVPGLLLYLWHWRRGGAPADFAVLALPILVGCLVNVLFFAEYRTRMVMEPFMILFALYALRQGLAWMGLATQGGYSGVGAAEGVGAGRSAGRPRMWQ